MYCEAVHHKMFIICTRVRYVCHQTIIFYLRCRLALVRPETAIFAEPLEIIHVFVLHY